MNSYFSIGVLAEKTSCNVPTIRYYEQIGLLPEAGRSARGHRHYGERDIERLLFIKRCRDFGFPIEQVRSLIGMLDDAGGPCIEVRDLASAQLDAVRVKLAELRQLEQSLVSFVANCDSSCAGGTNADCCIIDELSPARNVTSGCGGIPAVAVNIQSTEIRRR